MTLLDPCVRAYGGAKRFVMNHRTKLLGAAAIAARAAHDNFTEIQSVLVAHPHLAATLCYSFGICAMVLGFLNSQHRDDPPA